MPRLLMQAQTGTAQATRQPRMLLSVGGKTLPPPQFATPEQPKGFWGGLAKGAETVAQTAGGAMQKASDVAFGTTGKTAGGLVTRGIGSATQLYGQATGDKAAVETGQKIKEQAKGTGTPLNIAFTALETYPGGAEFGKYLSKLPGGEKVAEFITKELPASLRAKAIKQYTQIFNPTTQETKAIAEKTVPKMLDRGQKIFGGLEKFGEKAVEKAKTAGGKIDEWFKALPTGSKEQIKPILDKIQKAQNFYKVGRKVVNETAYNAFEKIKDSITSQTGERATANLRKFRQIWDEHFDVSKGLSDIESYAKKAQRAGADAIRSVLSKKHPELGELNKEFTFWRSAAELAEAKVKKEAMKVKGSFFGGLAGAVVGFEGSQGVFGKTFGTGGGAVIGSMLGNKMIELWRSPMWNSMSAVEKNKLAEYLAKGDLSAAQLWVSKTLAGTKNILPSK